MGSLSKSFFTFRAALVLREWGTRIIFPFHRIFSGPPRHFLHGKYMGSSGTTALEYGIILPILLLFILGIIDTGRLIWTYTTLYRATEAAARCGAINANSTINVCSTTSQIQQAAVNEAWGLTVAASAFTVTTPTCGLRVTANYTFQYYTPGFTTITLVPTACFPSQ